MTKETKSLFEYRPRETFDQPDRIKVQAEMYLRRGEWNILVYAPEWIVGEFGSRGQRPGHKLWIHNYGGGMGEHSFLIGTIPIPKKKRWWRFGRGN